LNHRDGKPLTVLVWNAATLGRAFPLQSEIDAEKAILPADVEVKL